MRKTLFFIFFLSSFTIYSQYTLIPDKEFESFLVMKGYDTAVDGKVLTSSINTITELDIFPGSYYVNIKELTGIEDFTSLKKLTCSNCQLYTLDLSKNTALTELVCEKSKLTNLNLTNCVNLEKLMCSGNQLTSLDLSTNINLKSLTCQYGILEDLNIEKCTKLEILALGGNNLSAIDLSPFHNLLEFGCSNNQLTNLDISKNPLLNSLGCDDNQLINLNTSANPNLTNLVCRNNKIQGLDFTNNPKLRDLLCEKNQITRLDFTHSPEILTISCANNKITEIDITKSPKLYSLICNNNNLTSLDTYQNPDLNFLNCEFNSISSIDITKNQVLELLRCNNNQLTYLNINIPKSWAWWSGYNSWINNPDLKCIFVSDANYFTISYSNRKDATATYIDESPPKFESANQTICTKQNPTIADITVQGYGLKWFISENSTTELPANTPLVHGKTYYAMNTSGSCEGPRSSVTISLDITAKPTANSPQTLCNITNPTLSNLLVNGLNIKWYNNITGGNSIPNSTTLINGITYYASQTLNGCESERIAVSANLLNTAKPIAEPLQTFCVDQNAKLDAIQITGQNIKWYSNLTEGTLVSATTVLQDKTTYYASQNINGCESERVPVKINIQVTFPPTGNSNQLFCTGQNPAISNIEITGNSIKWYDALTNGNLLSETTTLENGKTYYASQTENNCESPRFGVTVSIVNTPSVPSGNPEQSFCKKENKTLSDIHITGQNVKWFDSMMSASTLPNTTLLENNRIYYASQTIGCESDRTPILVHVYDTPLPIGNNYQQFCIDEIATLENLNITGTNIKWYDSATAGNILPETTLLQNEVYYATQTLNSCESDRFAVNVKIQDTQIPIADSPQQFCIQKNAKISDIDISGQNIKWYESISSNTSVSESTPLENGITYYATQTINNCESDRIPVVITILEATTSDCINFVDELPFPKFFTPNGDGYNDFWTIDSAYLAPNTGIKIYDRYGKLIKELAPNTSWNGTYIGNQEPASDYWFVVKRVNGTEFRGHFSLKR